MNNSIPDSTCHVCKYICKALDGIDTLTAAVTALQKAIDKLDKRVTKLEKGK